MGTERKRINGKRAIFIAIIILSVIAAIKTVCVCVFVDEEYQITLGYRLLRGERLFTDIWDPHQTSAFLVEFLMWVYVKLFSTYTGIMIWVRAWGAVIHLLVSAQVFLVLRKMLSPERGFILAAVYFALLPKNSIMPDYSFMYVWALSLVLVHLFWMDQKKNLYHVFACGFWMCIMVLSYPSSLLIFPIVFVFILRNKEYGIKSALIFSLKIR